MSEARQFGKSAMSSKFSFLSNSLAPIDEKSSMWVKRTQPTGGAPGDVPPAKVDGIYHIHDPRELVRTQGEIVRLPNGTKFANPKLPTTTAIAEMNDEQLKMLAK
jgi:hypothetical protein